MSDLKLHIGSESEFVRVSLPSSYSRDGWAKATVELSVNCFHGTISSYFDTEDLEVFYKQLQALYKQLKGSAELSPRERQFVLTVGVDSGGHISVAGEAWSDATFGNKLEFAFVLDQTFLVEPLAQLGQITGYRSTSGA